MKPFTLFSVMNHVIIYSSTQENFDICTNCIQLIGHLTCIESNSAVDTALRKSYFSLLKKQALDTSSIFMIANLQEIPYSNLIEELEWFIKHSVSLVIADIPSTHVISKPGNGKAIENICHVCSSLISAKKTKRSAGRPKSEFPDGWQNLYTRWKNKEITANLFMEVTGLKRSTFYSLVEEYEQDPRRSEKIQ